MELLEAWQTFLHLNSKFTWKMSCLLVQNYKSICTKSNLHSRVVVGNSTLNKSQIHFRITSHRNFLGKKRRLIKEHYAMVQRKHPKVKLLHIISRRRPFVRCSSRIRYSGHRYSSRKLYIQIDKLTFTFVFWERRLVDCAWRWWRYVSICSWVMREYEANIVNHLSVVGQIPL